MLKNLLLLLLMAALLPLCAYAGPPGLPLTNGGTPSERVRRGTDHFDKAFYDLTPHQRDLEAAHEYDLAIAEFQGELASNPSSTTAHAYLARIYSLRKEFAKAASHYDKLTEIDPHNIDAYVLASLAYAEAGQVAEARARLETARTQTSDPRVLTRLDDYLRKLQAASR